MEEQNKITLNHINDNWIGCGVRVTIPLTDKEEWEIEQNTQPQTKVVGNYELALKEIMSNVYTFHAKQIKADCDAEAGYIWSSRCSVMNYHFGKDLVDVSVNRLDSKTPYSMGISVSELKKILPNEYAIIKKIKDEEIEYRVIEKRHLDYYKERNCEEV